MTMNLLMILVYKKGLSYLLIPILWFSFLVEKESIQEIDPLLAKHFRQEEIAKLDGIRLFFNEQLLQNCEGSQDLEVCYQQFFDRLKAKISSEKKENFELGLPIEKQKALYQQIDEILFKEIWRQSTSKAYAPSLDSMVSYSTIDFRTKDSLYIMYLKDVSQEEPLFAQYLEPILNAGHLPLPLTYSMLLNPSGFDFSNPRHQLILAIHFLTLNDQTASRPR